MKNRVSNHLKKRSGNENTNGEDGFSEIKNNIHTIIESGNTIIESGNVISKSDLQNFTRINISKFTEVKNYASRLIHHINALISEETRIRQLLVEWSKKYKTKINIKITKGGNLAFGKHRIGLENITIYNLKKYGIENIEGFSFNEKSGPLLLSNIPDLIKGNPVSPEAWMSLINHIPGEGKEKASNLSNFLGITQFSSENDFYSAGKTFSFHTGKPLGNDDQLFYWQLFITEYPISSNNRFCYDFIDEYVKGKHENNIDKRIWKFGFNVGFTNIFFDVYPSDITPLAAFRTEVNKKTS